MAKAVETVRGRLDRAGFVDVGTETSFAAGVGAEVVEHIYRLDSIAD